jgi:hypothetical protein
MLTLTVVDMLLTEESTNQLPLPHITGYLRLTSEDHKSGDSKGVTSDLRSSLGSVVYPGNAFTFSHHIMKLPD